MNSSRCSGKRTSRVHERLPRDERVVHGVTVVGTILATGCQRPVQPRERAERHVGRGAGDVALRRRREHVRRLDPDHLGAEVAEERGEVGARPHRGEVEHADAAQRRHVGIAHGDRRRRALDVAASRVGASRWPRRGAVRRSVQPPSVSRYGAPGKQERAELLVDDVHPEPALVEMVRHEQLGGLVDRGDRPPGRLPGDA